MRNYIVLEVNFLEKLNGSGTCDEEENGVFEFFISGSIRYA